MTIDCEQRATIFQYFLIPSLRLVSVLIWFQKLQNQFWFSNQQKVECSGLQLLT